jgi:hypothetical protein
MEIGAFLELFNSHPALYFAAGVIVGYVFHGLVTRGLSSASRSKKPGRYHSKTSATPVKRVTAAADLNEPSFDWPEAAVKTMTPPKFISLPLDQQGNSV